MLLLNWALSVSMDIGNGIVKVFDVILLIAFRAVFDLANKILNCIAPIYLYNLSIQQAVYFKRSKSITVTINKNSRQYIRVKRLKKSSISADIDSNWAKKNME